MTKPHWTQTPEGRERMREFGRIGGRTSGPSKQHRNRKTPAPVAASVVRRPKRRKTIASTTKTTTRPANAANNQQARYSLEDVTAALAFGRVTEILKAIARQVGISESTLAERVGALLRTS